MTTTAVNQSSSALLRMINKEAISQFKLSTFLYDLMDKRTLPNGAATFAWPIINRTVFNETQALVAEGVTPPDDSFSYAQVTFTPKQYMRVFTLTDLAIKDSPIEMYKGAARELGRQMAQVMDYVVQNLLNSVTNATQTQVIFGDGSVSTRGAVTATMTGKAALLAQAFSILKAKGASTIGNGYFGVFHAFIIKDLLTESTIGGFLEVAKYAQPDKIINGEIGKYLGIRIVESENIRKFSGAGAAGIDVWPSYILGENAYGILESQALQMIVKPMGSGGTNDPGDQRGTVAGKVRFDAQFLKPEALVRLETATSMPTTTVLPY